MKLRKTWILIVCLLLTPLCGCRDKEPDVATEPDEVPKKQAALAMIERLGCSVERDLELPDQPVVGVNFSYRKVRDADLKHLKGLTQLQWLYLSDTKVTDAGLEHLKGLTQLKRLGLSSTKVTDAGLEHLQKLTLLQVLYLPDRITDAGLVHLKELSQLKELNLYGTSVTDAGLEHLKGLTQLRQLNLRGTKVTDAGVKKLQESLPNCNIHH